MAFDDVAIRQSELQPSVLKSRNGTMISRPTRLRRRVPGKPPSCGKLVLANVMLLPLGGHDRNGIVRRSRPRAKRKSLQQHAHRVPVDCADDFQRHRRVGQQHAQQRCAVQRRAFPGKHRRQKAAIGVGRIDRDADALAGTATRKVYVKFMSMKGET